MGESSKLPWALLFDGLTEYLCTPVTLIDTGGTWLPMELRGEVESERGRFGTKMDNTGLVGRGEDSPDWVEVD